jgi:hypothetical protein
MTTTKKNRSKNKKMKLYKRIEGGGKLIINTTYLENRGAYVFNVLWPSSEWTDINPLDNFATNYAKYLYGNSQEFDADDEYTQNTLSGNRRITTNQKKFFVLMDYINEAGRIYRLEILKFIKRNIDRVYPVGEYIGFNPLESGKNIGRSDEGSTYYYGSMKPPQKTGGAVSTSNLQGPDPEDNADFGITSGRELSGREDTLEEKEKKDKEYEVTYKNKIKSVNTTIANAIRSQVTDDPNNPSLIIPSPVWFAGELVEVEGNIDLRTTLPENLYTELLALQETFEREIFNAKVPEILKFYRNNIKKLDDEFIQKSAFIKSIKQANEGKTDENNENTKKLKIEYDRQIRDNDSFTVMDITAVPGAKSTGTAGEDTDDIASSTYVYDNSRNNRVDMSEARKNTIESQDSSIKASDVDIKYKTMKARSFRDKDGKTAFQNWVLAFMKSEEYDDFIKGVNIETTKANEANDKAYDEKMRAPSDIKKLAESKTFYNADIFEGEDKDALNTDLIDQLKKQEDEFNKTITELKAPFAKEKEDIVKKNEEALATLKKKIETTSEGMFKKLDEGITTNKQNRVERTKQETQREIDEKLMDEEDSALASLKNYKDCSSGAPRQLPPERIYQDVNLQDIIKQTGRDLTGGRKKNNSIANQVYLLNKRFVDSNGFESPMIRTNSARKKGGADPSVNVDPNLGIDNVDTGLLNTEHDQNEIDNLNNQLQALGYAEMGVSLIPVVGDIASAVLTLTSTFMADEVAKKEKELEERRKENERLLESWYAWKDNMERQTIQTLSSQEDPNIYKEMKKKALTNFKNSKPTPSQRAITNYSREIDAERDVFVSSRKAITDQISQNAEEIVDVIADVLQTQDDEKTELIDDGYDERKVIIDALIKKLKDYIKTFMDEQEGLDKQEELADMQAKEVADIVDKKQDELEDEAEDIADLKGYSACKTNVKSQEQMEEDALNELKAKAKQQEEDVAQGKITMQGLGKRYKKNSIANQVYMLNARYINSF